MLPSNVNLGSSIVFCHNFLDRPSLPKLLEKEVEGSQIRRVLLETEGVGLEVELLRNVDDFAVDVFRVCPEKANKLNFSDPIQSSKP